jgi:hypothetical protein
MDQIKTLFVGLVMQTGIVDHLISVKSEGENGIGQFVFTNENPQFLKSGLTDISIEMMCEVVKQIISHEKKLAGGASVTSIATINCESCTCFSFSNYEDEVNIINRLRLLLWILDKKINYTESELIKAQILLMRFYKNNIGHKIFRNFVDFFFIILVSLIIAHKISTDNPYSNSYLSDEDISNVDISTLNNCEIYFLKELKYDVMINEEEYKEKMTLLRNFKKEKKFLMNN